MICSVELTPPPTAVQRLPPAVFGLASRFSARDHHRSTIASRPTLRTVLRVVLLVVAMLFWRFVVPMAHEIPPSVVVRAFVKSEGQRLRVLVRVPLEAMRDVEFPLRGVNASAASLDLARADSTLRDAAKLWVADALVLFADDVRLAPPTIASVRASLPSSRAFGSYNDALALLSSEPLPATTDVPWRQLLLDVMLEYRTEKSDAAISMQPALAHLGVRTTTVLHYLPNDGPERVFTYNGDPGLVHLEPGWWQAASRFVVAGFTHILDGIDHLLFLLCLVIPFRKARPVIALVTAFTVAHSITLVASAAGYAPDALWFPPLIEVLIALSIVYMACENIIGAKIERRWPVAFGFGLIHGFGFSFALRDTLQFAGSHLALSLASFNVGVELGQLAVLAVMLPVLHFLYTRVMAERIGTVLLSAIVGHQAWHWMIDRGTVLRQYSFVWPTVDALFVANAMRLLAIMLVVGAAAWAISGRIGRWLTPSRASAALAFIVALAAVTMPSVARAQKSARSTLAGVYTAEQAQAGREVFVGSCTGCHTSASHTGAAFLAKWAGRPLSELYGFVSQRMPKTTPGSLSEDEYVFVVAYVLKLNGMPAGKAELSGDPELINAIRFDSRTKGIPSRPKAPTSARTAPAKRGLH